MLWVPPQGAAQIWLATFNSSAHQQHWKDIARGSVAHEYLFNVWDVKRAQSLCLDSPTIRTGASGPV